MRIELEEMITRFRQSQELAVSRLRNELALPLPGSGLAWALFCREHRLHGIDRLCGVPFYAHGYGVQIEIDGVKIDFDWGDAGQPDGFDGWRLSWHYASNEWPEPGTHSQVNEWLTVAHSDGELEKQGYLYYDPLRRSPIHWKAKTAEQSDPPKSPVSRDFES